MNLFNSRCSSGIYIFLAKMLSSNMKPFLLRKSLDNLFWFDYLPLVLQSIPSPYLLMYNYRFLIKEAFLWLTTNMKDRLNKPMNNQVPEVFCHIGRREFNSYNNNLFGWSKKRGSASCATQYEALGTTFTIVELCLDMSEVNTTPRFVQEIQPPPFSQKIRKEKEEQKLRKFMEIMK